MYLANIVEEVDKSRVISLLECEDNYIFDNTYWFKLSADVYNYLVSIIDNNMVYIDKTNYVGIDSISVTTVFTLETLDPVKNMREMVGNKIELFIQKATGSVGIAYFYGWLTTLYKLQEKGYIITDDNIVSKQSEINATNDSTLIALMNQHVTNNNRLSYQKMVYWYSLNVLDFIASSTDTNEIQNAYTVYVNLLTGKVTLPTGVASIPVSMLKGTSA